MIPGLERYNETGDTSLIKEYLEIEKDDLRVLVETAYELIRDAAHEGEEWNTLAEDWLAVAKRELEE